MKRVALTAVAVALLLAGCGDGGDSESSAQEPSGEVSASATAPAPSETPTTEPTTEPVEPVADDKPEGAEAVAAALQGKISTITKMVTITEDNDPNDLIGRPGGYVEAVSIYDSRAECDSELDITCGAKLEVFDNAEDAEARRDYIAGIIKDSPMFAEYDYLDGNVLLRVAGRLKPSEAKEYEAAFLD